MYSVIIILFVAVRFFKYTWCPNKKQQQKTISIENDVIKTDEYISLVT